MRLFSLFAVPALLLCLALPQTARADLIAHTSDPKIAKLTPLRNGLSAITFVWAMNDFSHNQMIALNAGLATVIGTGTDTLSAFESETYREVNGIGLNITTQPTDILLTLTAPNDKFVEVLGHLNAVLRKSEFSTQWYQRNLLRFAPVKATRNRRPKHVTNVLTDYSRFPIADDGVDMRNEVYRFGMPRQIILRTQETDTDALVRAAAGELVYRSDAALQTNKPDQPILLPKGVIYAPDPDASETMIYVVNRQDFTDASQQIAANLLLNYMGAYQGSEMFRIIRQELRAAYDPASTFTQIAKDKGLLSLSATVSAPQWPKILQTIEKIYTDTGAGQATDTGLTNTRRRLLNRFEYDFVTNPRWGAVQYLAQYPEGTSGSIRIPLFNALIASNFKELREKSSASLPPFSDYLIILIGGANPPDQDLRKNGFCEQPLDQSLRHCLEILHAEQN